MISLRKQTEITENKIASQYIIRLGLNSIHSHLCVRRCECVFVCIYNMANKNQTILGRWGGDVYVIVKAIQSYFNLL